MLNNEQIREICKAHFYGHTAEQIAELENLELEEVLSAITDGTKQGVFADLNKQSAWLKGEDINGSD